MPIDTEIKTDCSELVGDIDNLPANLKPSLENALAKCIDFILNIVAPGIKNKDSLTESEPEEYWKHIKKDLRKKTEQKIKGDLAELKEQLAEIQNNLSEDKPKIEKIIGVIIKDISELSQQLKQTKKRPKEEFFEQIDDLFFFYHNLLFRCCTLQQIVKYQLNPGQHFEPFWSDKGSVFHVYSIMFKERSQAIKACVDRLCGEDGGEAEEKIDFVSLHREVLMVLDEKCVKYFHPIWLGYFNTHVLLHREPIMPPETAFTSKHAQQNFIAQVWEGSKKILSEERVSLAALTGHVATQIIASSINETAKETSLTALAELDREYFKSSLLTNYFFYKLCKSGIVTRGQYDTFYQSANEKGAIDLIREISKQNDEQSEGEIIQVDDSFVLTASQSLQELCSDFEGSHMINGEIVGLILDPETKKIFTADQSAFLEWLGKIEPRIGKKRTRAEMAKEESESDMEDDESDAESTQSLSGSETDDTESDNYSNTKEQPLFPPVKRQRTAGLFSTGKQGNKTVDSNSLHRHHPQGGLRPKGR